MPNQDSFDPRLTADGRYFVFRTRADLRNLAPYHQNPPQPPPPHPFFQIYRAERGTTNTDLFTNPVLISQNATGNPASADCWRPSISDDGKVIAFDTEDRLAATDVNDFFDVYVRDFTGISPVTRQLSKSFAALEETGDSQEPVPRGDANRDGQADTSDAILILQHLFLGGPQPVCPIAADFDRSGELDISDPIVLLRSVYLGEPPLESLNPAAVPCG